LATADVPYHPWQIGRDMRWLRLWTLGYMSFHS